MVLLHEQNWEIILSRSPLNGTFQRGAGYNYLVISDLRSLEPAIGVCKVNPNFFHLSRYHVGRWWFQHKRDEVYALAQDALRFGTVWGLASEIQERQE